MPKLIEEVGEGLEVLAAPLATLEERCAAYHTLIQKLRSVYPSRNFVNHISSIIQEEEIRFLLTIKS